MKTALKTIKHYIQKKTKYWLILATFLPILFPHTGLAASDVPALASTDTAPIVSKRLWPDYDQTFDTSKPVRTKRVTVTAYNSEVGQTDDSPFTTAFGTQVRDGIIATNDLPRGTRVRFPEIYGSKVFTVEDRMNKRYTGTGRADIWMVKKSDAIKFGARRLTMEILPAVVPLADNK